MAQNTVVGWRGGLPLRERLAATLRLVARQTSPAEKISRLIAVGLKVRIVARDTTHPAVACGPAAAHLQLLKLIERPEPISFDRRRNRKYSHYFAERGSRPEVEVILPGLEDASISGKVALRADVVPNFGTQLPGIDNGKVDRSIEWSFLPALLDMDCTRPVTALTSDRQKAKGVAESGCGRLELVEAFPCGSQRTIRRRDV